jgi:hypothetical protein
VSPIAHDSLMVYEGDTLTVLGKLKYDSKIDSFTIENPIRIFIGGADDLREMVKG